MKKLFLTMLLTATLLLTACATPHAPSSETDPALDAATENAISQPEAAVRVPVEAEILCANEKYTITDHQNGWRINFVDGNDLESSVGGAQSGEIKFSSVEEMRSAFLNDTLTEQQIATIRQAFADDVTGIYLCDLNALYEPILPDGASPAYVSLTGTSYTFHVGATEQYASADIYVASSGKYLYLSNYAREPHSADYTSVIERSDTQFGDTPCETIEYVYPNSGATFRDHILSLSQDGVQTEIIISYRLVGPTPSFIEYRESETLPADVWIFQEVGELRFVYHISNLEIAPTVEWLSSFGVTPYVDTSDHVAS